MAYDFDPEVAHDVAHRPWPVPSGPWVMTQTWRDLLFAHWPTDPAELAARIPRGIELDLFEGRAWVSVVPFLMTNVGPRGVRMRTPLSEFPELNVRTYVRVGNRPGVFFFSLDAASRVAVRGARAVLNLPYFLARMSVTTDRTAVSYRSERDADDRAVLDVTYRPIGDPLPAERGTLDYFLTERYCLYHVDRRGAPYRLEIQHPLWRLRGAELDVRRNTMGDVNGLRLIGRPILHFSERQDVVAWPPARFQEHGQR